MRRVFYHHKDAEDCRLGMWKKMHGAEREAMFLRVANFMVDTQAFKAAMFRAIVEWPKATEMNLTTTSVNQQAWVGHAACFLAVGSPEEVTRDAWWTLTAIQQRDANRAADEAIAHWKNTYNPSCQNDQLELTF